MGRSWRFALGKHVTEAGVASGRRVFALELVTLRERTGARRPPGGPGGRHTALPSDDAARRLRVPLSWRRRLLYFTVMWHPSCVRRGFFFSSFSTSCFARRRTSAAAGLFFTLNQAKTLFLKIKVPFFFFYVKPTSLKQQESLAFR